jgi:hypothetical protein
MAMSQEHTGALREQAFTAHTYRLAPRERAKPALARVRLVKGPDRQVHWLGHGANMHGFCAVFWRSKGLRRQIILMALVVNLE